ncbi:hypothetical protein IWX63_002830 [Arthrobacter sp. CAN_A2]|uniref:hypothetical protein n=1 Tax=Arthrobacter sp. CAN_A2 TaxID=2787718 RepID=UPI0018EF6B47
MSEEDVQRLADTAAHREEVAFELEHAELHLTEAVVVALEHGTPAEAIAEIADLEPEEVLDLVSAPEEPALGAVRDPDPEAPPAPPAPTPPDPE